MTSVTNIYINHFNILLLFYLYSSNNKQAICNRTIHTVGQDSETDILNTALNKKMIVKERRPVGLPATGNERHGVQGSTPVSEGCDRYHPLLLP